MFDSFRQITLQLTLFCRYRREDFTGLKLAIKALEDEIDAIQLTVPPSNDWGGGNKAAKGKDAGPPLLSATLSAPRFLVRCLDALWSACVHKRS